MVYDEVRDKDACTATETSKSLEFSNIVTKDTNMSKQRTTKVLK